MISRIIKKIKQRKIIFRNMRDIQSHIKTEVRIEYLQNMALNSDRKLIADECKLDNQTIVSLTTFSKKIHEVHLVIESIAQQSVRPDRVILWLDENEFSSENIPRLLLNQVDRGLEIKFCPNYKSYKKIIPALKLYPDAYIITMDDDVLYSNNTIDILIREQKAFPGEIIGHRGHRIKFNEDHTPKLYKEWDYDILDEVSSHDVMLTGCGGIIYPPNSLHSDAVNVDLFQYLSPTADDLWLKIMAIKNDTLCKKTSYSDGGLALKRNRDIGLASFNVKKGGNDSQFEKLIDYYNIRFR
ncbi:glycosyl transferase [Marinomonas shanghaiensis]|uniref:glycosyl transferase n=1 Tax=Marinomonas shanghaiensis TaxID=2202418 RepID=UPI000DB97838|nr:glycosyl transferase [Marinomonas shanghaiensis]